MSDEDAMAMLMSHPYFQPHLTPVQVFNRATDPMLASVKPHTFNVLRLLDERRLTNHVLVITRWRVEDEDCAALNSYRHLRLTLLVTHSGIADERIEPVDSQYRGPIAGDGLPPRGPVPGHPVLAADRAGSQ